MSTLTLVDFNLNRDELIKSSLRLLGLLDPGETPDDSEISNGAEALNVMVKAWQTDGLQLWAQKRATILLEKDKASYSLGWAGDHATSSYTKTQMRVAGVTSDTILEVASTTSMAAANQIGIILDDGTTHWTTIASVTDSDTVVIDTGLASAAAINKNVYFYTSKIHRPLRITEIFRRDSNSDTSLILTSREEYMLLGNKTTTGTPNQAYYDPQLTNGVIYFFPVPDNGDVTMEIVYHRPFHDFDAVTDTPDFPQEWLEALKYGLAVRLAPEYGIPLSAQQMLGIQLGKIKERVMGWDVEDASVYFSPGDRYYQ